MARVSVGFHLSVLLLAAGCLASEFVAAHDASPNISSTSVAAVSDLKFREFYKMPVGPHGLQPTDKLMELNNKQVRMVGYMVKEENSTPGILILSPLPVELGDEDESLADDLPPTAVFVHLQQEAKQVIPYVSGLLQLTGQLSVGSEAEPDGRISSVRLLLDSELKFPPTTP